MNSGRQRRLRILRLIIVVGALLLMGAKAIASYAFGADLPMLGVVSDVVVGAFFSFELLLILVRSPQRMTAE